MFPISRMPFPHAVYGCLSRMHVLHDGPACRTQARSVYRSRILILHGDTARRSCTSVLMPVSHAIPARRSRTTIPLVDPMLDPLSDPAC